MQIKSGGFNMHVMDYLHRHIEGQVKRLAQKFKVILLLGARQVGKSTVLEHIFPEAKVIVFDPK